MPMESAEPATPPRLAILGTPRCGNTWLLHALRLLYDVPGEAVSTPAEVDWGGLPAGLVFQLHWHPTPAFVCLLRRHGFRAVVPVRHPLDCLLSVLHFSLHDRTEHWLEGEGGDERSICAAMPRSTAFLDYATGPRAAALLSVSPEWAAYPGAVTARYEDLCADPAGGFARLAEALGAAPRRPPEEVAAATTLARMQERTGHDRHFWLGRPGLWRRLLTAPEALRVAAAHEAFFAAFGYACDPDPGLTPAAADAAWAELAQRYLTNDLREVRFLRRLSKEKEAGILALRAELGAARSRAAELEARLHEATTQHHATFLRLRAAEDELVALRRLGPAALGIARRFHALSMRFPLARDLLRQALRRGRRGRVAAGEAG